MGNETQIKYTISLGAASRELYAQFLIRIYKEITGCKIGFFSKLKHIQANNFKQFRKVFLAKYEKGFIVPANTFDNVKGNFPIAFQIWNTEKTKKYTSIKVDIYDNNGEYLNSKKIVNTDTKIPITKWIKSVQVNKNNSNYEEDKIGYINGGRTDFQNQNLVFIIHHLQNVSDSAGYYWIHKQNLIQICIYFSVRKCIKANWINDRDQFYFPEDGWKNDFEFQNDCLIYTLFNNNISSQYGINHWIPFTAQEVGAKDNFKSDFMSNLIKDKKFGKEAKNTINAGKELWKYYHSKITDNDKAIIDASFYDIREFFQGRSITKGTMNTKSDDEEYNTLIKNLRQNLSVLAEKIQPKVYEYGFLVE
jgi:hypothetical protein